jgi:predicted NBD/HSP70 family sugar kinase
VSTAPGRTRPAPRPAAAERHQSADQAAVRAHNLAAVARLVRARGQCSRREIAETLRLNKGTVSSLVGNLIGRGLLEDGDHRNAGPGRPTRLVQVDTTKHAGVVVEILADQVMLSAWTLSAERVTARTLEITVHGSSAPRTLGRVRPAVVEMLDALHAARRRVLGVVVALPGLINGRTGELVLSAPLQWRDVPVRDLFQRAPQLAAVPVFVDRVANLATMAEWRALPGTSDLICLHGAATGLGAGVVTGGELLVGAQGRAGELLFPAPGGSSRRKTDLGELLDRLTAPTRPGQVAARDKGALNRVADKLGPELATLTALLDPQLVVLSGRLAPLADALTPLLRERLSAAWDPYPAPEIALHAGTYGVDAPLIGGAFVLADRAFTRALDTADQ